MPIFKTINFAKFGLSCWSFCVDPQATERCRQTAESTESYTILQIVLLGHKLELATWRRHPLVGEGNTRVFRKIKLHISKFITIFFPHECRSYLLFCDFQNSSNVFFQIPQECGHLLQCYQDWVMSVRDFHHLRVHRCCHHITLFHLSLLHLHLMSLVVGSYFSFETLSVFTWLVSSSFLYCAFFLPTIF